MDEPKPPRAAPRTSLMLTAHIWSQADGPATQHRVVNLSATGCALSPAGMLTPGAHVLVSIGQLHQQPARIVWVRESRAGLRFRDPIDIATARARPSEGTPLAPHAGWLAELNDAYQR